MIYRTAILLPLLFILCAVNAQDTSEVTNNRLVSAFVKDVDSKARKMDQKLDKFTEKALSKFQKQEARLTRKLEKTDSVKAAKVFANAGRQYKQLQERLDKTKRLQHYIPSLRFDGK